MIKSHRLLPLLLLSLLIPLFVACTDEGVTEQIDNSYGYVQFKLYKEASYTASKATVSELDYLSDAKRIRITLGYNNTTITQTVDLSAYDDLSAEYGMRSEKIYLLSGDYTVEGFDLFDVRDEVLYNSPSDMSFSITVPQGGMEVYDLTAKAVERGRARFTFIKDFVASRASVDMSQFLSTYYASVSLVETSYAETVIFDSIPVSAYSRYDDDNFQSIVLESDSLFVIKAGEWRVTSYSFYSSLKALLATGTPDDDSQTLFSVEDNVVSEPEVMVSISEEADYIQDYIALKAIWEALDGENWSYYGESYPNGANWNFNKEIDLWGYQPGVMLYENGRVASINLSEFGINGHMPAEIGQLTQLAELYLGTHNDNNGDVFASQLQGMALDGTLAKSRMEMGRAYAESRLGNPFEAALSPLLRMAYLERGLEIPGGISVTQAEIEAQIAGTYSYQEPMYRSDVAQGTYCNGLLSLPEEFGLLENLTTLFIANGMLTELPESMKDMENLTDVEIYNCQDMVDFPMALTTIPNLISLNISENPQWSAEQIYNGLDALFKSETVKSTLQLLYGNNNNLEELPESLGEVSNMGLLMMTNNKISKLHSMPDFSPVQLYLDYNKITEIPENFCETEDAESISFSYNSITKFPNIFDNDDIPISSVSFANNLIDSIEGANEDGSAGSFNGIAVLSLNLSGNKFTLYPAAFASSGSWVNQMNISNNLLVGYEENCFIGDNVWYIESLDMSYNYLTEISDDIYGVYLPYLYGFDVSYNGLSSFPYGPLNSAYMTIYIIRGQRDAAGNRTLKEWPSGIGYHTGMRGLFMGSNDLREIDDTISYLIYNLDIADNPNIVLDMSSLCAYIEAGYYYLYYDKTQDIRNCSYLGTY